MTGRRLRNYTLSSHCPNHGNSVSEMKKGHRLLFQDKQIYFDETVYPMTTGLSTETDLRIFPAPVNCAAGQSVSCAVKLDCLRYTALPNCATGAVCIAVLYCLGSQYLDKKGEMTYSRPIKRNRLPDLAGRPVCPGPPGADILR